MDQPQPSSGRLWPALLRNWISFSGLIIALGSLFSFLLLFILDSVARFSNPYVGILTYIVAPGFLMLGLALIIIGVWRQRRRLKRGAQPLPALQIDLSRPRDRRLLGYFLAGAVGFLFLSAVGSYQTYHFSESVQFCGRVCHTVMQPELTTYLQGPHARVACTECHIGPGATWFVRSKLSGAYQVYATIADEFPRPIPTPIQNLRPAAETCEQCHWPSKFTGDLDRTYHYFLGDETNTPYTIRMLLKVGGSDPTRGPLTGIHWHMSVANRIEYIPADESRQRIPWVRVTDMQGVVRVYRQTGFTNDIRGYTIRVMDCMDCHNRPAHRFAPPENAVNLALALGKLNPGLPYLKTNAVHALTQRYANETEARDGIATFLARQYPEGPALRQAIATVQQIYTNNFFPLMNANWSVYPDNISHMMWPGCFRCHDGEHKSEDGSLAIKAGDCNTCHTILTQGRGAELQQLTAGGQEFRHPTEDYVPGLLCSDCHGP